jgi:uncharacterized protein
LPEGDIWVFPNRDRGRAHEDSAHRLSCVIKEGPTSVAHFILFYELAPDYIDRRPLFRDQHLKHAWDAVSRGELIVGGALADPVDRAVLLFSGKHPEIAVKFAEADPYVREGLVRSWTVRPWTTVVGALADQPVRP